MSESMSGTWDRMTAPMLPNSVEQSCLPRIDPITAPCPDGSDRRDARPAELATVDRVLVDRRKTHGDFVDHARCTQRLKKVVNDELEDRFVRGQLSLDDRQCEALSMILHKIGRIVAGDAGFRDHWVDIAGYAMLCADPAPAKPTTVVGVEWGDPRDAG